MQQDPAPRGALSQVAASGVGQYVIHNRRTAAGAFFLSIVVGVTVFGVVVDDVIPALQGMGYVGLFVIGLLGTGAMVIPALTLPMAVALGGAASYDPVLIGLAATAGETLGSLTGYSIGRRSQGGLQHIKGFSLVQRQLQRRGLATIFVVSLVPNPLVKVATMAAGAARMPLIPFLGVSAAGKMIKFTTAAWIGGIGVAVLQQWLGLGGPGG